IQPGMTELYDNAPHGFLQHVGNIHHFLEVYFGFLYRKTYFYRLLSTPNDGIGFPPGVAEKMVLNVQATKHTVEPRRVRTEPAAQRESSVSDSGEPSTASSTRPTSSSLPLPAKCVFWSLSMGHLLYIFAQLPYKIDVGSFEFGRISLLAWNRSQTFVLSRPIYLCVCVCLSISGQVVHQASPDSYNGVVRDTYSWSQDYTYVEVRVNVPKTVVKGIQVCVNMQPGSVRVCLKEGTGEKVLMEGEQTHKINTENSLWNLEPGHCGGDKSKNGEVWWSAVLKGEKEIDVNQINREHSMATVDEEEHVVLDRLTFDYRQKLQGKPHSHKMKVHDMLKKGWDAEGFPFKGQQFDPSMFDIPPSAVQM
uniref:NudC domain containing 3 n=1 Tax=Hucho hucho TaxID=62062 RepID=A0A4W5PPR2_9TELE